MWNDIILLDCLAIDRKVGFFFLLWVAISLRTNNIIHAKRTNIDNEKHIKLLIANAN